MKKQIVNVSTFQTAKVAAVLYLVTSIPFVLIMMLVSMFSPFGMGFGVVGLVLMPLLYALFGFIFTAIAALIYNLVAARMGGFEFTSVQVDSKGV